MTAETNKSIIRRFLEYHLNKGITEGLEAIVSPDYEEIHEGVRYKLGLKGAKEHILSVRKVYPDLQLTIDRQIAEGEWVATCITASGTHLGNWANIPPSGKRITYTGVNVDRIVNGRIGEHGGAANMLFQLLETGAIEIRKQLKLIQT